MIQVSLQHKVFLFKVLLPMNNSLFEKNSEIFIRKGPTHRQECSSVILAVLVFKCIKSVFSSTIIQAVQE